MSYFSNLFLGSSKETFATFRAVLIYRDSSARVVSYRILVHRSIFYFICTYPTADRPQRARLPIPPIATLLS